MSKLVVQLCYCELAHVLCGCEIWMMCAVPDRR